MGALPLCLPGGFRSWAPLLKRLHREPFFISSEYVRHRQRVLLDTPFHSIENGANYRVSNLLLTSP